MPMLVAFTLLPAQVAVPVGVHESLGYEVSYPEFPEISSKSVRDNVVQLDVGNRETVLGSVLFAGHNAGQFETVTQLLDISRGHKAIGSKIMLKQVSNPFDIFLVSFLTTNRFHIFGMCKDDRILKHYKRKRGSNNLLKIISVN